MMISWKYSIRGLAARAKKKEVIMNQKPTFNIGPAIAMVQAASRLKPRNFIESIEIALVLGIDPRKQNQMLRGVVNLPHGTGKETRVAVFAKDEAAREALEAGASRVGAEDLLEDIQAGKINFEKLIATPDMMPMVSKVARILGPRGLMPNSKLGTIVVNPGPAVVAARGGQVEYRAYKDGQVMAGLGKVDFELEKLLENVKAFMLAIGMNKPEGAKGKYMKQAHLSSSMGKSVPLTISSIDPSNGRFMMISADDTLAIEEENKRGRADEQNQHADILPVAGEQKM